MDNMTKRFLPHGQETRDISYMMSNIENYKVLEKHDVQLNFRRRKMVVVFIEEAVLKFDENLTKHAIDVIEITT